jgi:hypothetical protein
MNGLRLGDLESADMLDVIHYLMEEDTFTASKEESDHKTAVRTVFYREFSGKEYAYKSSSTASRNTTASGDILPSLDEEFGIEPFDPNSKDRPMKTKPKPYVPPTNFNSDSYLPFGNQLDAPLN